MYVRIPGPPGKQSPSKHSTRQEVQPRFRRRLVVWEERLHVVDESTTRAGRVSAGASMLQSVVLSCPPEGVTVDQGFVENSCNSVEQDGEGVIIEVVDVHVVVLGGAVRSAIGEGAFLRRGNALVR